MNLNFEKINEIKNEKKLKSVDLILFQSSINKSENKFLPNFILYQDFLRIQEIFKKCDIYVKAIYFSYIFPYSGENNKEIINKCKSERVYFFYLDIHSKDILFIDNDDQLFKKKQFILNEEKRIKYFLNNNEFFHPSPDNYECISNLIKSKEKSNKKNKLKLKYLLDEKQINYIIQLGYISSHSSNKKYFIEKLPSIFHLGFLIPKEQYLILIKHKNKKTKETILFYFDLNEGISLYDLENYKKINSFYNIMNNYCLYRDDINYYLIELEENVLKKKSSTIKLNTKLLSFSKDKEKKSESKKKENGKNSLNSFDEKLDSKKKVRKSKK